MTKIIDKNKARQGREGSRVLVILVVALVLAGLAWAAAELFGSAIEPENPVNSPPAVEQPAPAPAQPAN